MDDINSNYAWIKEKSLGSMKNLDKKLDKIQRDISELNDALSNYSVSEVLNAKKHSQKDVNKKMISDIMQDIFGLVGYTNQSVCDNLEVCQRDVEIMRETIDEYHELLDDKISKLHETVSRLELKKPKKGGDVYDMYLTDPQRSDRSEESRREKNIKKDIKFLNSQIIYWKKNHKQLFDTVNDNQKLYSKIMKNKNMGPDSMNTLKELFTKSNSKLKDVLRNHYELHYKKSHKPKSHRDKSSHKYSISGPKETRSHALLKTEQPEVGSRMNDELVNRIANLKNEIRELKSHKDNTERKDKDFDTFKSRHTLLKQEFEEINEKYRTLKSQAEYQEQSLNDLTRTNTRLSTQLSKLETKNKTLEELLEEETNQKKSVDIVPVSTIISRAKSSLESQISSMDDHLSSQYTSLEERLELKDKKLRAIEAKFAEYRFEHAKQNQEIHENLNRKLISLESEKSNLQSKLQRANSEISSLKIKITEKEDDMEQVRKEAEEMEANSNKLYENRLEEKNREMQEVKKDINNKEAELLKVKEDITKEQDKIKSIMTKIEAVKNLIGNYVDQQQEAGKSNPTLKLVMEELQTVGPNEEGNKSVDRLDQMRELLREKSEIEKHVDQLRWDLENETNATKQAEKDKDNLRKKLDQVKKNINDNIEMKDSEIDDLQQKLDEKDNEIKTLKGKVNKLDKFIESLKQENLKSENLQNKFKDFITRVFNSFSFHEQIQD